jgi:hypothetical protein
VTSHGLPPTDDRIANLLTRAHVLAEEMRIQRERGPAVSQHLVGDMQRLMSLSLRCVDLVLEIDEAIPGAASPVALRAPARLSATGRPRQLVLDIGRLAAQGLFETEDGWIGLLHQPLFSYHLQQCEGGYRFALSSGSGSEEVTIVSTRPKFGGARYWFLDHTCQRRALHLYSPLDTPHFACARCKGRGLIREQSLGQIRAQGSLDLATSA